MNTDLLRIQLSRLTWLVFGALEALLGFRIFFKLIGANPSAQFVRLIYEASGWLLRPFRGIVSTPQLAGGVIDLPAMIALMSYLVVGGLIVQLVRVLLPPTIEQEPASQA